MGMVPINPKQFCRKAAFSLMLFFAGAFLVQSVWAAEAEATAVLNAYHSTQNTVLKRKALRMLSEDARVTGEAAAQWKKDLLLEAIGHKDPTVVESAVYQIKMLKLAEFNQKLIGLYHNAGEVFANMYDSRVMIGIVNAFAITGKGDNNVFSLFQDILNPEKTKFTYIQGDVLNAIKLLNDPKYVPMVEKYNKYMQDAIAMKKAAGENIMMYQVLIGYSTICEKIFQTHRR